MKLDLKRIEAKLQFIEDNLALIRQLAGYSEVEFVGDVRNVYTSIHALQISIEALLDIFSHIVARLHLGAPSNDREMLELLLQKRLISDAHAQRYFQMSKFRNKVVHGYMDVDPGQVYAMLQRDLDDFQLFFADIKRIIENAMTKERTPTRKKTRSRK